MIEAWLEIRPFWQQNEFRCSFLGSTGSQTRFGAVILIQRCAADIDLGVLNLRWGLNPRFDPEFEVFDGVQRAFRGGWR